MTSPIFHRSEGDTSKRLSSIEDYLARVDEHRRERDAAIERGILELERRVSKLETWQSEVYRFIGETKVKWAVVNFVTGMIAAITTAALIKVLNL